MKKLAWGKGEGLYWGALTFELKRNIVLYAGYGGADVIELTRQQIRRLFTFFRGAYIIKNVKGGMGMIDTIELAPNESAVVDTTANIVSLLNFADSLEVRKEGENDPLIVLNWGEIYTLGVAQGRYIIKNTGDSARRVFIFRQFIL